MSRRLVKSAALIVVVLSLCGFNAHHDAQASFNISEDAFSISNSPGYCFAMVAFSRWYYLTRQDAPPLRKVIPGQVQQKIAKELQEFYSQNLIRIQADYCNKNHAEPTESFRRFLAGLVAGEPKIVLLMNKGSNGAVLHAVLAYEWMPELNMIKVYDPNYVKEERFIDLAKRRYTSLDITYNSVCFPEVLHSHAGLAQRMERLYAYHVNRRLADRRPGPIAQPILKRAQGGDVATD